MIIIEVILPVKKEEEGDSEHPVHYGRPVEGHCHK